MRLINLFVCFKHASGKSQGSYYYDVVAAVTALESYAELSDAQLATLPNIEVHHHFFEVKFTPKNVNYYLSGQSPDPNGLRRGKSDTPVYLINPLEGDLQKVVDKVIIDTFRQFKSLPHCKDGKTGAIKPHARHTTEPIGQFFIHTKKEIQSHDSWLCFLEQVGSSMRKVYTIIPKKSDNE